MEENNNPSKSKEDIDNLVNNYIDDIFKNATSEINKDAEPENEELEDITKNLLDDIFKTSLENAKSKDTKKKKKKKDKKYRLKTLTIDTKIDVIDEEDSEESPEDKKKNKKNEENKVIKHSKLNSDENMTDEHFHKINNNLKNIKKLKLIRPPLPDQSKDDFYLNKLINNNEKNNKDDFCSIF